MKTPEELAEEYADRHAVRTDGGGWEETTDYLEQQAAFLAGYQARESRADRGEVEGDVEGGGMKTLQEKCEEYANGKLKIRERELNAVIQIYLKYLNEFLPESTVRLAIEEAHRALEKIDLEEA